MKSFLVALTLCLAAVVFDPSTPVPESYELRCRGGGLKFNSTQGRTSSSGEQMMNMTVDFAAGTQGSGAYKTLSPGQCSWVDRGFRNGEPTQIRLEIVDFAQLQQSRHGSPVDRSPTAAESYPDAQNVPQYLTSADHYWSFWVYNTGNGHLQSTRHRYFKPLKTPPGGVRVPPPVRSGSGNVNES